MVAEGNSTFAGTQPAEPPIDFRPVLEQLVRRRHQLGMRQSEVAEAMHTGQPTVCILEKSRNPKLSTLMRYAHAVGATISVEVVVPDDVTGGGDA